MATILDNRTTMDQTIRIFDSFYAINLTVAGDKFDIVNGYFTSVCETKNIAGNFTAILFRISQETGIDVLLLLDQIKKAPNKLQMSRILAYYMNSFKSRTSLYGVGSIPIPVAPVARNIVQ